MQNGENQPMPDDAPYDDGASHEWFDESAMQLMEANDELVQTRRHIVDLLSETEDILLWQNPRIEAEWQVTVGVWENNLLEAQIAMRRAKRACSLVQASVNTGKHLDTQQIEEQLDKEFEQWREQLETAVAKYQSAVESQVTAVYVSASTANEIKRLFRTLAKRLHPDVNPSQDESTRRMFALAELAYRKGDVKILKSLEISTRGLEPNQEFATTLIEAQAELALLHAQECDLELSIEQLKAEKPYSLRSLLEDKEWLERHIADIKRDIDACHASEQEYRARYEELVGSDV